MQHLDHRSRHLRESSDNDRSVTSTSTSSTTAPSPASPTPAAPIHRERAASQPHPNDPFASPAYSLLQQHSQLAQQQTSPWAPRLPTSLARTTPSAASSSSSPSTMSGLPASLPVPTRSSSFSGPASHDRFHNSTSTLLSAMRDNPRFASTFEDDESEALSDSFSASFDDTRPVNGRLLHASPYAPPAPDSTRSRSQSLLVPPPASVEYLRRGWHQQQLSDTTHSGGGAAAGGGAASVRFPNRYSGIDHGFLSATATGPTAIPGRPNRSSSTAAADISNISPFTRDIHQILSSAAAGNNHLMGPTMGPPGQRDDPTGGASGTTSRRHSVSYYQPRRDVGFQAPGVTVNSDDSSSVILTPQYHTNVLSDEELASDLNMLNINMDSLTVAGGHSQPSSLPNFPQGRTSNLLSQSPDPPPPTQQQQQQQQSPVTARYLPGIHTHTHAHATHTLASSSSDRATSVSPRTDTTTSGGAAAAPNPFAMAPHHLQTDFSTGMSPTRYGFSNNTGLGTSPVGYNPPSARPPYNGPTSPSITSPLSPGSRSSAAAAYSAATSQPSPYLSTPTSATGSQGPPQHLNDLGKGLPLHAVPPTCPLYIVEFKAGRTDLFYTNDRQMDIRTGDLVIVEADRGKDLGKVINDSITLAEVEAFQKVQAERAAAAAAAMAATTMQAVGSMGGMGTGNPLDGPLPPPPPPPPVKRDINPKQIYGKAGPQDTQLLSAKLQDEMKALQLCQSKVRAKKLPMEVVDAEYQWDRRKLTFYFIAEKRIDFRELVRELFRLYKTRIWMASLQGPQE